MPKTGRPVTALMIDQVERTELLRLAKRGGPNPQLAFRANLVLQAADGVPATRIAKLYRTTNQTVGKWRARFIKKRLAGLFDEPRVGRPRLISDAAVEAVVVKTLESKPKGETHWSTRTMAAAAGISFASVGRIWRSFGLKPHIVNTYKLSNDP